MRIPEPDQGFYGKTAVEMITGAAVQKDGTVYGIFKKVQGYTEFNESDPEEQQGYYFPFLLKKKGSTMTFKKNGEDSKTEIQWEENNVFRVEKNDRFEVLVDGESVVTLNFEKAIFEE